MKLIFMRGLLIKSGLLAILLTWSIISKAQQDPQFSQYMFNTMSVNPAYVGSNNDESFIFTGRSQWVGLRGAPNTQILSYDRSLRRKVGIGASVINDVWGPASERYLDFNTSYTIDINRIRNSGKLAFGFKVGARFFHVDWSKGTHREQPDPNFAENINKVFPTVGFGLYYYEERFYWGVSIPNLLRSEHYNDSAQALSTERMHFFIITGYVFRVNDYVKFKPAVLAKAVYGSPLSLDFSASMYLEDRFWGGLSWRWGDSIAALLGMKVNDNLDIGYSYDLTSTALRNFNSGTHEIMLKYVFNRNRAFRLRCF